MTFDPTLDEVPTTLLVKDYPDALRHELERENTINTDVPIVTAHKRHASDVQIALAKPHQTSRFSVLDAKPRKSHVWRKRGAVDSNM